MLTARKFQPKPRFVDCLLASTSLTRNIQLARALLANASEALAAPLSLFISQISSDITVADKLFAAEALVRETARQP